MFAYVVDRPVTSVRQGYILTPTSIPCLPACLPACIITYLPTQVWIELLFLTRIIYLNLCR